MKPVELHADVVIIGGGLGGIAAARAVLDAGRTVILTDENKWLGGQMTSQLVPLDEHLFIEDTGANASYREFRDALRDYYRAHFPLIEAAREDPHLNPGAAWVTRVCVDPRVAVAVIDGLLLPYESNGQLRVLRETKATAAESEGDRITGVTGLSTSGVEYHLTGPYVLDATELGDLLELGGIEHVSGRESYEMTGEPTADDTADPTDMQGVTWCFAIDHIEGEDHTIEKPAEYDFFRDWAPEQLGGERMLTFGDGEDSQSKSSRVWRLDINPDDHYPFDNIDPDHRHMGPHPDLWTYRRIAARNMFEPGFYDSDITIVNWPMNDYVGGALFGVPDAEEHWLRAKELSRCLLYWLQTEAPRPDGGRGWPGIRLRADIAGTDDGFAQYPYIREGRRIKAKKTITEQEVSVKLLGTHPAKDYPDTVGVGHYFWIDRHPSTVTGRRPPRTIRGVPPGNNLPQPFQIPLGALIPERVRNVLPACKNIGTTQITNGCYRLHPVEWSIGEAAGALAAYCLDQGTDPHEVYADTARVADLQRVLTERGVQLHWPEGLLWDRNG